MIPKALNGMQSISILVSICQFALIFTYYTKNKLLQNANIIICYIVW